MTGNTMLYFSLDGDERAVYPASNFLGVDLASASSMQVSFKKEDGTLNAAIVALTFTGNVKNACQALASAMAGKLNGGLTTIADTEGGKLLHPFTAITNIS